MISFLPQIELRRFASDFFLLLHPHLPTMDVGSLLNSEETRRQLPPSSPPPLPGTIPVCTSRNHSYQTPPVASSQRPRLASLNIPLITPPTNSPGVGSTHQPTAPKGRKAATNFLPRDTIGDVNYPSYEHFSEDVLIHMRPFNIRPLGKIRLHSRRIPYKGTSKPKKSVLQATGQAWFEGMVETKYHGHSSSGPSD